MCVCVCVCVVLLLDPQLLPDVPASIPMHTMLEIICSASWQTWITISLRYMCTLQSTIAVRFMMHLVAFCTSKSPPEDGENRSTTLPFPPGSMGKRCKLVKTYKIFKSLLPTQLHTEFRRSESSQKHTHTHKHRNTTRKERAAAPKRNKKRRWKTLSSQAALECCTRYKPGDSGRFEFRFLKS